MKIQRPYVSIFSTPREVSKRALQEFKRHCWQEPTEDDLLRDTAIDRKRLEFIKRLVEQGRLKG